MQQSGGAGGSKFKANIEVNLYKPAFLPFKKALLYARSLKLKSQKDWAAWRMTGARAANIPSRPDHVYKHDGWQGYGHWLGTGNQVGGKLDFLPFKKALLYARSLKLTGKNDWQAWCKSGTRPANIPSAPDKVYKHKGWQGYGHWLGTGNVAAKDHQFLPFKEGLLQARSLQLKNKEEWKAWCKSDVRPPYVPSRPDVIYKHDGGQGYEHWLGTGKVAPKDHKFLPFKDALLHARSLKLKSKGQWEAWRKSGVRTADMPSTPERTYKHEGWQGYGHWLGTGSVGVKEASTGRQMNSVVRNLEQSLVE